MNLWPKVRHLFEVDDGTLPDIYIQNLTNEQIVLTYEWVMSQCAISQDPVLWSTEKEIDVPICEIQYPAREFVAKRVETFRHLVEGLCICGVTLPQLSVSMEDSGISFD